MQQHILGRVVDVVDERAGGAMATGLREDNEPPPVPGKAFTTPEPKPIGAPSLAALAS